VDISALELLANIKVGNAIDFDGYCFVVYESQAE